LHDNSRRGEKSFVSLNCGALPETLLESELFGSVKGAYTGSVIDKKGWFKIADGGTIFFDEIGEMSPSLQIKLLRVLPTGEYTPVGSTEIKKCDVRVLTATHQHLPDLVKRGTFRSDLFYRINVLFVKVPPLRKREKDILLLANYFLRLYGKQNDKENLTLGPAVEKVLLNYTFPGNVRELENAIQGAAILVQGTTVRMEHLPEAINKTTSSTYDTSGSFAETKRNIIEKFEREYVETSLLNANGVVMHAAKATGMDPKNLYKKMEKYKINPAVFKK
jgi:transcriptional regulator with PAS, ATPase and Fis domain